MLFKYWKFVVFVPFFSWIYAYILYAEDFYNHNFDYYNLLRILVILVIALFLLDNSICSCGLLYTKME